MANAKKTSLPRAAYADMFGPTTGDKVRLRMNKKLLEAYAKEVQKHVGACRDACRRAGGRFVDVPVDAPLDQLLRRAFAGDEGKSQGKAG